MAKKVAGQLKLQVKAGSANPSPPIGPALGQRGINIMEFCKSFNAATQEMEKGMPIPVVITYYQDKSFTFVMKQPPMTYWLKKEAKITSGSKTPGKGAKIDLSEAHGPAHALLFGEDQARYVLAVPADLANFLSANAEGAGIPFRRLGTVGGDALAVDGLFSLPIEQLRSTHESWFPDFMDGNGNAAAAARRHCARVGAVRAQGAGVVAARRSRAARHCGGRGQRLRLAAPGGTRETSSLPSYSLACRAGRNLSQRRAQPVTAGKA